MFKFERCYGGFLALLWIVHIFVITVASYLVFTIRPSLAKQLVRCLGNGRWCYKDAGGDSALIAHRPRPSGARALPLNEQLFRLPVRLAMNE